MSKRFGRNQRRRLLARVEGLENDHDLSLGAVDAMRQWARYGLGFNCTFVDDDMKLIVGLAQRAVLAGLDSEQGGQVSRKLHRSPPVIRFHGYACQCAPSLFQRRLALKIVPRQPIRILICWLFHRKDLYRRDWVFKMAFCGKCQQWRPWGPTDRVNLWFRMQENGHPHDD